MQASESSILPLNFANSWMLIPVGVWRHRVDGLAHCRRSPGLWTIDTCSGYSVRVFGKTANLQKSLIFFGKSVFSPFISCDKVLTWYYPPGRTLPVDVLLHSMATLESVCLIDPFWT
ncbi:hypothetical protein AAFF_G00398430 [Aldrovandia affinis]|uniref:Uncharacterized protein n=1 Tax=Aldrovandia affinis TaxID=143900 RepID=A0AAD7SCQ0_9TELE|nr:hypothetical protein AAFF_G00398430 [Aldrovandia affinis]